PQKRHSGYLDCFGQCRPIRPTGIVLFGCGAAFAKYARVTDGRTNPHCPTLATVLVAGWYGGSQSEIPIRSV
ncbi:MAG: hypothetical protein AB7S36_13695, partial [Planctomycetota bacterium]